MTAALHTVLRKLGALLPPVRRLAEARQRLDEERIALLKHCDNIESERDELKGHCERLNREAADALQREGALLNAIGTERDELHRHLARMEKELDTAIFQRETLETERDQLRAHAERMREELETVARQRDSLHAHVARLQQELHATPYGRELLWISPGHFYSPIVNPGDPRVLASCSPDREWTVADRRSLPIDEDSMLELFHRIAAYCSEVPFPEQKTPGRRYYFENPTFSYADALTLFGLLLELRPKRLIEVGCGFSSIAAMDTNDLFLDGAAELTFIDPYPETLLSLLDSDDPYRVRVRAIALQDAPLELFTSLAANDILFIDSSHVAKMGSDVNDYFFRLLPALQPGVVVHIHDIFYPFEYPAEWVRPENRSWNEAYVLHAFLQYNSAFQVLYFNNLMYRKYPELCRRFLPLCLKNTGGSIWLQKVR